jgi:hypothetical protein
MIEVEVETKSRRTCENCGLPSWEVTSDGIVIEIEDNAENKFQRTRKRSVWCHSDECAIQTLMLSKYGKDTSRFPITLAQFRATKPLDAFRRTLVKTRKKRAPNQTYLQRLQTAVSPRLATENAL